MIKSYSLLIVLFFLLVSQTHAKDNIKRCETQEKIFTESSSQYFDKYLNPNRNTLTQSQAIPDTIHVIVHVLWSTSQMNIPDSMILKQLQILNEDFPRLNADTVNTPAPFAAISGRLPIRFALAHADSMGSPISGIIRVQTTHGPFGFNTYFDMTHSANGGDNPWNSHFMNIYCAETASGVGGVGWMGSNICLISYQEFGVSRVATHELGHVFGLGHIWGPEQSTGGFVCSSDDGIADTPEQWSPIYSNGPFPVFDSCTSTGNGIMYMNYMNYNIDAWENMFSQGQVALMTNTLNTTLNDLINNVQVGTEDLFSKHNIEIYPNPNKGKFKINFPNDGDYEILFSDILGSFLWEIQSTSQNSQDVELDFAPGIYFCTLKSKNSIQTKRIIVE